MFYNYLLVALRNLKKQPGFTAIKVLSLSLGLVCSLLVLMHVQYTSSYDKHFENWQNIYRVVTSLTTDQRIDSSLIPEGVYNPLLQDYGQIEESAKIQSANALFTYGDTSAPNDYLWVEPEFLTIFSFDFVQGDRHSALTDPNTIVLTQSTAAKYFGQEDPMGKNLTMENRTDLRVTGVIRDLPPNTHFEIDAMIGTPTGRQLVGENFMNGSAWAGYNGTRAYVVISDPESAEAMRADLPNFVERNVPDAQRDFVMSIETALDLEPLADIQLSPRQGFAAPDNSRRLVLAGLVTFAALILLSSCINFANLSLSQMQQRGKETGIRKTLGATRSDLLTQFMAESMLLTLIALLVALPVVYFAVGPYTTLTATAFTFASMFGSTQVLIIIVFVLATGLLSGLIPAIRMSQFAPTAAISGKRDGGKASRMIRSGLTIVQFTFAVVLVVLAIGITLQVRYLNEVDIGFNRSNLVVLDSMYNPRNPEQFNYDALVNDLRQHPGILTIGKSEQAPPNNGGYNPWRHSSWPADEIRPVSHLGVDENYVNAMQLQLLAGRNFSQDFPADYMPAGSALDPEQTYGILVTPAAIRNFGLGNNEEAIDQILMLSDFSFRVVGVVNEFRLSGGLEDTLRSTSILRASSQPMRSLLIRLDPAQRDSALQHIDSVWAIHRPDAPINREFYEQSFNQQIYEETNGINRAAQFAALITIVIAALGLYALAFYSTQRRTKEIGVRKVLGATASSIVQLLSLDFIKPVIIACLFASVLAYFVTAFYFGQFSAPASLSPLVYVLVIAGMILLSLLTVAAQCIKTAKSDPVLSLRSE
ncbi:MAG: ABC transporter permease [Pseudohongiella sp.]|nr:ABC transporter permease [Pseudohongiella sp.]